MPLDPPASSPSPADTPAALVERIRQAAGFLKTNQMAEAEALLEAALQEAPAQPDACQLMGLVRRAQGRREEAETLLRLSLAAKPAQGSVWYNLGLLTQEKEASGEAERYYNEALIYAPKHIEARMNRGNVRLSQGRMAEALEDYREAVRLAPERADAYYNIGVVLVKQGNRKEAEEAYRQSIALRPQVAAVHYNLGNLLRQTERPTEALAAYDAALALQERLPQAHSNRGQVLQELGRLAEAGVAFRRALELQPDYAEAWHLLVTLDAKGVLQEGGAEKVRVLYDHSPPDSAARMHAGFALARLLAAQKDYTGSFTVLSESNRIKRRGYPAGYLEQMHQLAGDCERLLTKERIQAQAVHGVQNAAPILVVGLPRSGTSLLEQMLASHTSVFGAGERDALALATTQAWQHYCGYNVPYPVGADGMPGKAWHEIGEQYLSAMKALIPATSSATRITDKMPGNFRLLGVAAIALPQIKIVHILRHPLDTCLSIFEHHFTGQHPYAYDLGDLAYYYRCYWQLMKHWRAVLPSTQLHEVCYESLVQNQERELQAIMRFCDLPWEPQCLQFHETGRLVQTASSSQVHQPLYQHAMQRWKPYAQQLQPLVDALGEILPEAETFLTQLATQRQG